MATTETPTTVQQLQAQLPALQAKMTAALDKYNNSVSEKDKWRSKALWCDAERDKYTLGSKKEKACSMADRGLYYNNWGMWENNANADLQSYNLAKQAVDNVNKQISAAIQQQTDALNTDPTFNLQQQQIKSQAANEAAKIQEEQKTTRMVTIVLSVIGGIGALLGVVKLISYLGNKKAST